MKSEVMGEMERLARPLIEEAASAWIAGLPVTLSPRRAQDYARAIELMAQCIDAQAATERADKQLRWLLYRLLAIIALFVGMFWLSA